MFTNENVMIVGENELELSCKYIFQNETSKHLSAGEQVRNKCKNNYQ